MKRALVIVFAIGLSVAVSANEYTTRLYLDIMEDIVNIQREGTRTHKDSVEIQQNIDNYLSENIKKLRSNPGREAERLAEGSIRAAGRVGSRERFGPELSNLYRAIRTLPYPEKLAKTDHGKWSEEEWQAYRNWSAQSKALARILLALSELRPESTYSLAFDSVTKDRIPEGVALLVLATNETNWDKTFAAVSAILARSARFNSYFSNESKIWKETISRISSLFLIATLEQQSKVTALLRDAIKSLETEGDKDLWTYHGDSKTSAIMEAQGRIGDPVFAEHAAKFLETNKDYHFAFIQSAAYGVYRLCREEGLPQVSRDLCKTRIVAELQKLKSHFETKRAKDRRSGEFQETLGKMIVRLGQM
jgi:hypothetical protein